MIIHDRKNNLFVKVLNHKCLQRPCYVPQLAFKNSDPIYVCGRRELHGCPVFFIEKEIQ